MGSRPPHKATDTPDQTAGTGPDAQQRFSERRAAWMAGSPSDWATESFGIARDMVYQLGEQTTDERDEPAFRLSAAYRHAAGDVAAEQLEKAGCRLAMVLNRALER